MRKNRKKRVSHKQSTMTWAGIILGCAVVFVAASVVGVVKVCRRIAAMPEFQVNPAEIALDAPLVRPQAMIDDFIGRDNDGAGVLSRPCSLFTRGLCDRVAGAYAKSPWVRRVIEVRKVYPNKLHVDLELRKPFAVIESDGNRYCLGRDGVALDPQVYLLTPDVQETLGPIVRVPDGLLAPSAGERWQHGAVEGGLAMLETCRQELGDDVNVETIVMALTTTPGVEPFVGATLVLAGGTRVEWGKAPIGRPSSGEVPTERKIESLRGIVAEERGDLSRLESIIVWSPGRTVRVRQSPPAER